MKERRTGSRGRRAKGGEGGGGEVVETDRVVHLNVTYKRSEQRGVGCASPASATTLANP